MQNAAQKAEAMTPINTPMDSFFNATSTETLQQAMPHLSPEAIEAVQNVQDRVQKMLSAYTAKNLGVSGAMAPNPMGMSFSRALGQFWWSVWSHPESYADMQNHMMADFAALGDYTSRRLKGEEGLIPIIAPQGSDRRFKDERWQINPWFDYCKQAFLLANKYMVGMIDEAKGLDDRTRAQAKFAMSRMMDALSPSNYWMTNPQILEATLESGGENFIRGMENVLRDLEQAEPHISMVKPDAFKLGKDLASTAGQVVYRNELLELLQYTPTTAKVHKTPVLIISPWINKYYVLDMREQNSYVKWLVDQGHTVYMTSWRNPDASFAETSLDDYARKGVMAAVAKIQDITGEDQVNAVGYCIGGTLLSMVLSYFKRAKAWPELGDVDIKNAGSVRAKTGKAKTHLARTQPIKAATFLTTLLDFSHAGDLSLFVDEEQLAYLSEALSETGVLNGVVMHATFNVLRANDLIWSFVVNNYLLGKEPFPFDLLYWNSDATNLPRRMHLDYLRWMYLENRLIRPEAVSVLGQPIDIHEIDVPCHFISTMDDHIAPWQTTYAGAVALAGDQQSASKDVTFTLAASGHIAGVVNPPAKDKYHYWVPKSVRPAGAAVLPEKAEAWLKTAEKKQGSWWPEWQKWLASHSGAKTVAKAQRMPKAGKDPVSGKVLPSAPGEYVQVRSM